MVLVYPDTVSIVIGRSTARRALQIVWNFCNGTQQQRKMEQALADRF